MIVTKHRPKSLLTILFAGFITLAFLLVCFMGNVAHAANAKQAVCEGAGLTQSDHTCEPPSGSPDVNTSIKTGINLFSAIVGIIAVVMIMVGGVKFIMSQGDAAQVNTAKNTIIYACVGILVVVLSQIIVKFVLERFTT